MHKLIKYFSKREWAAVVVCLIFIVAQVWLDLRLPDFMSEITRLVQTPGSDVADIGQQGAYMLLCTLGSVVCSVVVGFYAARVAASFARRIRAELFGKVLDFALEEIKGFSTGSLITRSTNDVVQVQMFVTMALQVMIKAPIMAVWALTKIAGKNFQWTVLTGGAVAILLAVIAGVMFFVIPKFKIMQTHTDHLNSLAREGLTGLRMIRAYNAQAYQGHKFAQANAALTDTKLFTSRGMALLAPSMGLVMNGLVLAIYWSGAMMVANAPGADRLTIFSNMVVFSAYAMQVIMAFVMMAMMFVIWPRASVSANRINAILQTRPSIVSGALREGQGGQVGCVEFKNVSFKYPDAEAYVLKDISFTAKQGETVAFIGSTGSGKSTLVHLVPRFFDATEGEVCIDGVNVKDYTAAALAEKIGYVPQKAVLFSGSVADNIAFGEGEEKARDLAAMAKAAAIAQATDFVEAMPEGYEAQVSRSGSNLSGGQKQRLSIARAVYRQPEIYVFDDSFSALDYKTDAHLRAALKKECQGATTLLVAQRIGTIIDADQIIVLEQGRMVGQGRHEALMASCAVYREIAQSQFNEEAQAS